MKIIVAFDKDIEVCKFDDNDILLTNKHCYKNSYSNSVLSDYSLCDEHEELSNSINNLFINLPSEYLPFRNTFFMRVFRPLHSIINQLENLIKVHKPSELVLIGGSEYKFITLNGGEGEGEHFLYKSSWLFNSFIYEYFISDLNINWINKKPAILLKLYFILREQCFFLARILSLYTKTFLKKTITIQNTHNGRMKNVFAFVNLPLQLGHLENLFKKNNKFDIKYITSINSLISGKKINEFKVRFKDYILAYKKYKGIKNCLKSEFSTYTLNERTFDIDLHSFTRSVKLNFILYYSKFTSIYKFITSLNYDPKNSLFVTNMTFGEDIILLNNIARALKIPHYNFQAVTMSKMIFPQMKLSDKYFLYAYNTYNLYKRLDPSYFYYFPSNRSPKNNFNKNKDMVLSLFTQPDLYTEQYLEFLIEILPLLETLKGIQLIIKPHYRQNRITEFKKLSKEYSFVKVEQSSLLPEEIIKKSDFILSMTSSVLFEAITLNRPGIIIDFYENNHKLIYENDICFPTINFVIKTKQELMNILDNPVKYQNEFYYRKSDFINRNSSLLLADIFEID